MSRSAVVLLALVLSACSFGGLDEDATGEQIYGELCARCHGADLSGSAVVPPLGPGSNVAGEDDEYIEFTVRNGRGRMPSFPSLDETQLERLISHIREVQSGE
ncbi:MAG: c-type cytochrome [Actinomycetota bacterium]